MQYEASIKSMDFAQERLYVIYNPSSDESMKASLDVKQANG